jgi:hypothetical protein
MWHAACGQNFVLRGRFNCSDIGIKINRHATGHPPDHTAIEINIPAFHEKSKIAG